MGGELTKLPILIVYPHSRCDCRCTMCDIWRRTETEELTAATVRRWQPDLKRLGVEEVVLSGGEPLMHSDLGTLVEAFRAAVPRVTLLTTGQKLSDKAELVAAAFDSIVVSLDGPRELHDSIRRVPGAFDRLDAGVRAVRSLRHELPIHGRCTVQKANHLALLQTVKAVRAIGLHSLSFLAADVSSEAFDHAGVAPHELQSRFGLTIDETQALNREVEALIADEAALSFVRETPHKLRAIVARFRARLGLEEPVAPRCTAPWVSAVIEVGGAVRPCFFHGPVGNAVDAGLWPAIQSDAAVRFRANLNVAANPICRNCVCSLNRPAASA